MFCNTTPFESLVQIFGMSGDVEVKLRGETDEGGAMSTTATPVYAMLRGYWTGAGHSGTLSSHDVHSLTRFVTKVPCVLGRASSGGGEGAEGSEFVALSEDPTVSRHHVRLSFNSSSGEFELEALKRNCVVDGVVVRPGAEEKVVLRSGACVRLGRTRFYFLLPNGYLARERASAEDARALEAAGLAEEAVGVLREVVSGSKSKPPKASKPSSSRSSSTSRRASGPVSTAGPQLPKLWQMAATASVEKEGEVLRLRDIAKAIDTLFPVAGKIRSESLRLYVGKDDGKRSGWRKAVDDEIPEEEKRKARPKTSWFVAVPSEENRATAKEAIEMARIFAQENAKKAAAH